MQVNLERPSVSTYNYVLTEKEKVEKIKQKILRDLEIHKKPHDVNISTMTTVCSFDTEFDCKNIAKYIELSHDGIISVTHSINGDHKTNRSVLLAEKDIKKKKKKNKSHFFNQVSMCVSIKPKKTKPVNVKIFLNGAIQMTGCTTIDNAIDVLLKILPLLKSVKAIINYKENKVVDKMFAKNIDMLKIENMKNFKIVMINSNFVLPFRVDRLKLYNLMLSENIDCLFDPIKHACVNIKYDYPNKIVSIFVFENGPIIITGVKNCDQIYEAYTYIYKYLLKNIKLIVKSDPLTEDNILKYINRIDHMSGVD